ncbi:MAG: DUF711 family protein [Candidatus Acidiferrales bacterium]
MPSNPKIRALTVFIRLDRARYDGQIADALSFLRRAEAAFEKSGYEVQTIRITTQSFLDYTRDLQPDDALGFLLKHDALAVKEGFDAAIGPAMIRDSDDPREAEFLARILSKGETLEGTIFIADEGGIRWNSIRAAAKLVKYLELNSPGSIGCFYFMATAFVPSGTPFYPGSYFTGERKEFSLGLESADVVTAALASAKSPDAAEKALAESLGRCAEELENAAMQLDRHTGWKYGGIDLTPAPLKDVSIGRAIENFLLAPIGSSGTLAVAALITRAIRSIRTMRAGYSGLMLPVLEDTVLAERWTEGRLSIDSLLSYSSVCGTGLDCIPLPGDITQQQIERIFSDVASLAFKWRKPLTARLLPVAGKKAGDMTEFDDPFLVNANIQPLP